MELRSYILDTDIGPDCDDTAALALACVYNGRPDTRLLAVMHCTSSPWGVGAIRAIADWYGLSELPVGTLADADLLVGEQYERYNRALALGVSAERRAAGDCLPLYRRLLAAQPDGSVDIIGIGPLRNLANLLRSQPDEHSPLSGRELVARKVRRLTLMAGEFGADKPRTEWNVAMDIESARLVAAQWPGELVYCGFELGIQVTALAEPNALLIDNPVRTAYRLYAEGKGRYSWDLCTVQWAMSGSEAGPYARSEPGVIDIDAQGVSTWRAVEHGRHSYLAMRVEPEEIAASLERTLCEWDERKHEMSR